MKISSEPFQVILEEINLQSGNQVNPEAMKNTARRMSKAFSEWLSGYKTDPKSLMKTTFKSISSEMVLIRDISFNSLCEHHAAAIYGVVSVGYIPKDKILGLSKIIRLVDCFSRRLQLQERLTCNIADALMDGIDPLGVGVVTSATHMCVGSRGVNRPGSLTVVSSMRGLFNDNPETRAEFLGLIK